MNESIRLARHIKPEKYELLLKPDLDNFTFEGEETILLNIEKSVRVITLHSKDIEIESAILHSAGEEIIPKKIIYNSRKETVSFIFPKSLKKGEGRLRLVFRGLLNDQMAGFYRSRYWHQGKEKFIATTQFEATDARRAFPCFDEPAQKAVFEISLLIPGCTTAISNTVETEIKEYQSGYKIVRFAPTPKMSTYLVAFIVGDFESIEKKTKEGIKVRVFTTPGKKYQAEFALECAAKTLSFFSDYFGIPYPLPALDLIAIPDFAAGAMENWGAVTYRESALLVDPAHSSTINKQWVALVIAHELAHQWFGNLVTMEWWTHLWLNEGFASYVEYLAIDHLFPEWDIWTQFVWRELGQALELDALQNTHPIEVEVHHPNEISEIFDAVSYSKGAAVIKMLANLLGEENFRRGLRHYLKKHAYANATTDDLWLALEEISRQPVRKIMRAWTQKAGYPLVSVRESGGRLLLKQERFYSSRAYKTNKSYRSSWPIPVEFITDKSAKPKKFLFAKKRKILIEPRIKWLKFNAAESGVYRTAYSENLLSALTKPIEKKRLATVDRLGVIRDAFSLAEAGKLETTKALELSLAYKNETDYPVWTEMASSLETLDSLLSGEKFYEDYKALGREIFSGIAERVGWRKTPKDSHTKILLRTLILRNYGHYGDPATIGKAEKLFASGKNIDPDLRSAVYNLTAENGSTHEYKILKRKYVEEVLQEEKNRLGRALTCFQDKNLLRDCLEFSLSEKVRPQDFPQFMAGLLANPHSRPLAWEFLKANWRKILKIYGGGGHLLSRIIRPFSHFNDEKCAEEIERFFGKNPAPAAQRTIQQVLEKIRSNAAWARRDGRNIAEWLKRQKNH